MQAQAHMRQKNGPLPAPICLIELLSSSSPTIFNRSQNSEPFNHHIADKITRAFYQEVARNNHHPNSYLKPPPSTLTQPIYHHYNTVTPNPPSNTIEILNNGPPKTPLHPPRHPLPRPLNMAPSRLPHQQEPSIQIKVASTATNPFAHIRCPNTGPASENGQRGSLTHVWRLRRR